MTTSFGECSVKKLFMFVIVILVLAVLVPVILPLLQAMIRNMGIIDECLRNASQCVH